MFLKNRACVVSWKPFFALGMGWILSMFLFSLVNGAQYNAEGGLWVKDYRRFSRAARFEPSGVAWWPGTRRFVVVNDKQRWSPAFSVYVYDRKGRMRERDRFALHTRGKPLQMAKLEAVTASRLQPGLFYAISGFNRHHPAFRRIARFRLEKRRVPLEYLERQFVYTEKQYRVHSARLLQTPDLRTVVQRVTGKAWFQVEGLTLTPDEQGLLVGIRCVGASWRVPEHRVMVVRIDLRHPQRQPELILDKQLVALLGRPEGVSGLTYVPEFQKYVLITSYEDSKPKLPIQQVGGHVWVLPKDLKLWRNDKVWREGKRWRVKHKPEGLAVFTQAQKPQTQKLLLIYDDDNDRKSKRGVCLKGCFDLLRNEAMFSVLPLPFAKNITSKSHATSKNSTSSQRSTRMP
ncbi:MAG: hypothetical protein AAGJ35_10265 [Myxococcota bacterium]